MRDKLSGKQRESYIMPIITGCIGGLSGTMLVLLIHVAASLFQGRGLSGFWHTTNRWGIYLLDMAVASVTAFLLSWILYRRRDKMSGDREEKEKGIKARQSARHGSQATVAGRKIDGPKKRTIAGNSLWKETQFAEEIFPAKESWGSGTKRDVGKTGCMEKIETGKPERKPDGETGVVFSPIQGQVVQMEEVPDDTFAAKVLGDGLAVIPSEGKVFAPFDGRVEMVYDAKNAVSVSSLDGMEVLVHVGINTVDLAGKYFKTCVTDGDSVQKGDLLLEFDIAGMKEAGYATVSPVILTNSDDYEVIQLMGYGVVDNGDVLIQV